jgi:Ni,Fe-hydrogenase III small subunit
MRYQRKSFQLRHVDAGSCNACEQELTALLSREYDIQRFGIDFVASPRHADALVVTGPVTDTMKLAVEKVWQAVPLPRRLIAVGDCAAGCGVCQDAYASHGGLASVLEPPDLVIRGCPPSPQHILEQLLHVQRDDSTQETSTRSKT